MHSSRMHTAPSSSRPGGLHQAPPRDQTPLGPDSPGAGTPPPPGPDYQRSSPPDQILLGAGTPRVNRITDTCKNITFQQLRLRAVKDILRDVQFSLQ